MNANWVSHSGLQSVVAPPSTSRCGVENGTGMGTATAGRAAPRMRPKRSSALAMVAPVLPAPTIASARPSRTDSAARTTEASFFVRTDTPGSSFISMTCEQATSSTPAGGLPSGSSARTASSTPNSRTSTPS